MCDVSMMALTSEKTPGLMGAATSLRLPSTGAVAGGRCGLVISPSVDRRLAVRQAMLMHGLLVALRKNLQGVERDHRLYAPRVTVVDSLAIRPNTFDSRTLHRIAQVSTLFILAVDDRPAPKWCHPLSTADLTGPWLADALGTVALAH